MENFINIKQEIRWGDWYFRDHVADPAFDYKAHKKECSEYYRKRGFFASMMFSDFYSRVSGVESDRYMPMDVYFFYALPCLNRWDLRLAYTDKNLYSTLFPDVKQPETVIKNINGIFFDSDGKVISFEDAVKIAKSSGRGGAIIKPTLDTCNGVGVALLNMEGEAKIKEQFASYNVNFILQKKVEQHPEMGRPNATSLNTLRMFTYRDVDGRLHYLEGKSFYRFGGRSTIMDNASAGGGVCKVYDDGRIDDRVLKFRHLDFNSLSKDYAVADMRVPNFGKAIDFVLGLHERLPYFDYIGWDVAIDEAGAPVFIEHNVLPSVEGPQIVSGPVFGEYLDEVMDRITVVKKQRTVYSVNKFRPGFNYMLPIG